MTENTDSPSFASSSTSVADLVVRHAPSIRGLVGHRGPVGAALLWRDDIFVASAAAIGRERRLAMLEAEGTRQMLDVIGVDFDSDVAVLRPTGDGADAAQNPPAIDRTPATAPRTGDFVIAIAPDPHCGVQASFGRLGAVGGAWRSGRGGGEMSARWRLDGGLYPGFEGALVIDATGHVLGLASSAFARMHGMIVPAETVDRVVEQLLRDGRIARPYLGLLLQPARVRVDGVDADKAQVEGALVASLADEGPADAGGLRVGDVIVGLAGQVIDSPQALHRHLATQAAGANVDIEVVRGGARRTLPLTLGTRPDANESEHCGHGRGHRHDAGRRDHGHGERQRADRLPPRSGGREGALRE
ncbi:MAG TPA: PDZ domain-containing protein [Burkholderiaceae bacterium]|jgi:S1-C subfamily serine protease|nr:PDZ domain-containing protein [Burkholderiaceae bacterium]